MRCAHPDGEWFGKPRYPGTAGNAETGDSRDCPDGLSRTIDSDAALPRLTILPCSRTRTRSLMWPTTPRSWEMNRKRCPSAPAIPTEDPKSAPGSEAICDQSIDRDAKCSARNGACFSTRKCCIFAAYSGGTTGQLRQRRLLQSQESLVATTNLHQNRVLRLWVSQSGSRTAPQQNQRLKCAGSNRKAYPATSMAEKTVC